MATLRKEVLDCIGRCKASKSKVMAKLLFRDYSAKSSAADAEEALESLLHPRGCAPESRFKAMFEDFVRETDEKLSTSLPPLFMPASNIVHFVKASETGKEDEEEVPTATNESYKSRTYLPVLTTREAFIDYLVSPTMGWDHMPDRYLHAIKISR